MNRSIIFSNTAFNINKLEKISEMLDNNDKITGLDIYSSRVVKENNVKIKDSKTFHTVKELINYITENNVKFINDLEINIYYKNENKAILKYDEFFFYWELSYEKQDSDIDSIIYNLKPIMKNNIIKIFRQYRSFTLLLISVLWISLILMFKEIIPTIFSTIILFIYVGIFFDMIVFKNVAVREYNFLTRKKDDIILSVIFYILGVITPYAINLIGSLFEIN